MIEQGSQEWKELRLGKLTASRMADVLASTKTGPGAGRKNYMAQLIAERLTGNISESFSSQAMEWGVENEVFARAEYEIQKDCMVDQVAFVDHPSISWCGASPDGLVGSDGLVEIKCPNTATHIDYLLGQVPPLKYIPQMALQLACTERKWCDFVSYDPRMPAHLRLFVVRFIPGPDYMGKVDKEARTFLAEVQQTIDKLTELSREK